MGQTDAQKDMMSDQTILVTGAAGFIGFHIARQLLAEGRHVVGLDNLNDYYDPALKRARLAILRELQKLVIGQAAPIDEILIGMFAGGTPTWSTPTCLATSIRFHTTNS